MRSNDDLVVKVSKKEGGKWEFFSENLTRGYVNLMATGGTGEWSQAYIAYMFANGDIWDTICGWRSVEAAEWNKPVVPYPANVFTEANTIIWGDREKTYGDPAKNLRHIAQQWTLHLQQKFGFENSLSIEDVCWMMVELKKCRQLNANTRDNLVDAVGYIGLIERCA